MAKRRGQIQIAVDKIDAQIADLQRVKQLLLDTVLHGKLEKIGRSERKAKPKADQPRAVPERVSNA